MRRSTCGGSPATQSSAPAAAVGLDPHRAALAAAMHDAMRLAAQRHLHPMRERRGLRQALEPRRDPAAMLLREFLCFPHAAAGRHGENDLARRRVDAQRVAACLAMTAQAHQIDRFVKNDLHGRGLARTAIQQRTKRHRRKSTLEQPRAEYCHSDDPAQHDPKNKPVPPMEGFLLRTTHNTLGALRFESIFTVSWRWNRESFVGPPLCAVRTTAECLAKAMG